MLDFLALLGRDYYAPLGLFQPLDVPARTLLLSEGRVATDLYFVREGGLRAWFLHEGRDRTLQFYFEGAAVSSLGSFLEQQPSSWSLSSLEPTRLWMLPRLGFEHLLATDEPFQTWFHDLTRRRVIAYSHQLASFLRDTPTQRYERLLAEHPDWLQRIPQHYLASYLGMTAVSLSRIRNRRRGN
jgi:CRP-like cAMP-binding protein